jgi:chromosomal replication initiation ATPase DnaA
MTTTDRADILAILHQHHDMLGVDKRRVKELINAAAAIQTTDARPTPESRAISAVEQVTGVTLAQMQARDRTILVKDARHIMIYILRVMCHGSLHHVGRIIARDHSTVAVSVSTVNKQPRIFSERIKEIQNRLNQTR